MRSPGRYTMAGLAGAVLVATGGCGGDGKPNGSALPVGAVQMQTFISDGIEVLVPGLGSFDAVLPFLSNPSAPGAAGLVFTPDPSPGAPPGSWVFDIPLDGDGDGATETVITGTAVLSGDPSAPAVGFSGTAELTIDGIEGLGDFTGTVAFELTADGTLLSGQGTFVDQVGGTTTVMSVASESPLLIVVPIGQDGVAANACAYSLNGDVGVESSGPSGLLGMVWGFVTGRSTVRITDATYVDPEGQQTAIPDASVTVPCNSGALADWNGVFLEDYACLSPEHGLAQLTIAVVGGSRLHIIDEDPPGSGDVNEFDAFPVAGNPHVVRGYFLAGPPGYTYREDFSWTLGESGVTFNQVSVYEYQEGVLLGSGGI